LETDVKGEFYKMHYEDWDEGTDGLTLEQEGAYLRLCHQMYRRRGPIPEALNTLARIWRCHPNKARKLLQGLLDARKIARTPEGYLVNSRVTQELDHRQTTSTYKSNAGRAGGMRSGESRRNSLKNHDAGETAASSNTNERREEKEKRREREEERTEEPPPSPSTEGTPPTGSGVTVSDLDDAGRSDLPPPKRALKSGERHFFEAGVIRLTKADYAEWERVFGEHLNLPAVLRSLAPWANKLPPGKWFDTVPQVLAKKDQEARLAIERVKAEAQAKATAPPRKPYAYIC
jgi:uncharacterized protein YdaU (DUF1376 family)